MHRSLGLAFVLCAVSLSAQDLPIGRMTQLAGMQQAGMVIREANGIPHCRQPAETASRPGAPPEAD